MHVFKISVGQKVVGQTSWLAHWEQKVGGQLPALPNRLRRQYWRNEVRQVKKGVG